MPEQKIYIHAFISACISIFIPLFVWGNIIAFLPWLANKFNLLDSSLGFFFMFYAMMQIIVSQISGRFIIPKIGSKKTQALGMLIFSTHTILLGLAYNNLTFILSSLPAGIALGLMFPTCTAITGVAEEKTKKILQPLFTAFISIGFLFGALSSGIFQYFEFHPPYVITSLSLLALIGIGLIFYFGLPTDYENFEKAERFRFPEKKNNAVWFIWIYFHGYSWYHR